VNGERRIRVGRRTIEISNPDKVLYPRDGITKADVVEHYRRVATLMLPHLRGRPTALERYPDGIGSERIFQKNVPRHFPSWIARVTVRKEGGSLRQVVCRDAATLVYLANQACITPHVWLSRADRLDRPDQMIFDLDPPGEGFEDARVAALSLRSLLEELELPSFVKTTGGKGDPRDGPTRSPGRLRHGAAVRSRRGGCVGGAGSQAAHDRAAQGQAAGTPLRGRHAQRLRADRRSALRSAGQAGCDGGYPP